MWAGCKPYGQPYCASNVIHKKFDQLYFFPISAFCLSLALKLSLNTELDMFLSAVQAYCLIPWAEGIYSYPSSNLSKIFELFFCYLPVFLCSVSPHLPCPPPSLVMILAYVKPGYSYLHGRSCFQL